MKAVHLENLRVENDFESRADEEMVYASKRVSILEVLYNMCCVSEGVFLESFCMC